MLTAASLFPVQVRYPGEMQGGHLRRVLFGAWLLCGAVQGDKPVGYFFRNLANQKTTILEGKLPAELAWLAEVSHLRLIPGSFPQGLVYHFDGEYTDKALQPSAYISAHQRN
jgi:hypothetical protein